MNNAVSTFCPRFFTPTSPPPSNITTNVDDHRLVSPEPLPNAVRVAARPDGTKQSTAGRRPETRGSLLLSWHGQYCAACQQHCHLWRASRGGGGGRTPKRLQFAGGLHVLTSTNRFLLRSIRLCSCTLVGVYFSLCVCFVRDWGAFNVNRFVVVVAQHRVFTLLVCVCLLGS